MPPANPFWLFISSVMVLLLPGAALLAWLPQGPGVLDRPRRDLISLLADAIALSISISVIAALGLFVLRVRLAPAAIAVFYGVAFAALVIGMFLRGASLLRAYARVEWLVVPLLGFAFLSGLLALRFYQARDLALPAWVDPVHHTLIVRLILENGGLPESFLPYFNTPFYYHFGFHLLAALFTAWSGLSPDQAVLWFGQVLNACVSLSVYRVTFALGDPENRPRSIAHALLAALLVGFAFHMPAYYLTWGRYTLLSGLILLGPAMAAALDLWANPRRTDAWVRLALLVAGLSVTHYFALILAAIFFAVLGFFLLDQMARGQAGWAVLWRMASASLGGILLTAPWLYRVWSYNRSSAKVTIVDPLDQSPAAVKRASDYFNYLSVLLGPNHNYIMMGMSGVGFLASLRRPRMRPLAIWALLLVLLAMPWGLRLGPFRPDYFGIILFFPAGILLAELLVASSEAVGSLFHNPVGRQWMALGTLAIVTSLFLIWGVKETKDIINSVTIIGNKADLAALNWVRANTTPKARFYINSTVWFTGVYRGVDGGYWLEPDTGRFSLVPPGLYAWGQSEDIKQINAWAERSNQLTGCTAEFWSIVREANLNYVYLREGVGKLQPAMLSGCSNLKPVYQQNGVSIYEILRPLPKEALLP